MLMDLNMNRSLFIALTLLHVLCIKSASNINLEAPKGFKIELFASGLGSPRQMAETDDGYIIVGTIKEGDIYALKDM